MAKVVVVVVFGIAEAVAIRLNHVQWASRGKEAFLAAQARRFDQSFVTHSSFMGWWVVGVVMTGLCLAAYEFFAWGIWRAIRSGKEKGVA